MSRHYGPQTTGQPRPIVDLDAQTEQVWGVWSALWSQRAADATGAERSAHRMDIDTINKVIAEDTPLGDLLRWAVDDAETTAVQFATLADQNAAQFVALQRLHAEWLRLNPPVRIAIEQEDTCRHGVSFGGDCADCDADF